MVWTRQLWFSGHDMVKSVSVGPSGSVFVAGQTNGALPGQSSEDSPDAFVPGALSPGRAVLR